MHARGTVSALVAAGLLASASNGCFPDYSFAPSDGAAGSGGGTVPEGMVLIEPPEEPWPVHINSVDGTWPRDGTVRFSSAFYVDATEVTTGRFRAWLEDKYGLPPSCDAGACSLDHDGPYEGVMRWEPGWNAELADRSHLGGCDVPFNPVPQTTWEIAQDESAWNLPMTCVTWYDAVAFCASEGKRLLTEAEWVYTASDGHPGQLFPWGSTWHDDCAYSIHRDSETSACGFPANVGTATSGATQTGVYDMAGSVFEWVWDAPWTESPDGAFDYTGGDQASTNTRVRHGGAFIVDPNTGDPRLQNNIFEFEFDTWSAYGDAGFRCAKTVP